MTTRRPRDATCPAYRAMKEHPMSDYPTIECRRSSDGRLLEFTCPWCTRTHTHGRCHQDGAPGCNATGYPSPQRPCTCPTGTGDGHRVSHCRSPQAPCNGYVLREVS